MRYLTIFLPIISLLAACGNTLQHATEPTISDHQVLSDVMPERKHDSFILKGDFADSPEAVSFINRMVREHGFEHQQLYDVLAKAKKLDWLILQMDRQAPNAPPPNNVDNTWTGYRKKFLSPGNIQKGVVFWDKYQKSLQRASLIYGVPPEIIVGILGVETRWGQVMGDTRVIDSLATLSFNYPRRAEFFSSELKAFMLMTRSKGIDPFSIRGSFAGAMGYPQFMPSSFKSYAIDFNDDGHINLWDPVDAIGSVASYFRAYGWQREGRVAIQANGQAPELEAGYNTRYSVATLAKAGLSPKKALKGSQQVSLLRLDMGGSYQYWFGLPNFYTITRYNHSVYYAMAVWQLGEAVSKARHNR